jgi:hypothetical protein
MGRKMLGQKDEYRMNSEGLMAKNGGRKIFDP